MRHAFATRHRLILAVFAAALVVRLWHVLDVRDAPFASLRLGDAASYDAWAREIAAGDLVGDGVFYQAPLYPYFLAGVYRVVGDETHHVRLVQGVLGALSCALLAAAGATLFSPAAGTVAGLLLALYAPAIFFDGLLQKTSLALFLLCLFLWLFAKLLTRDDARPGLVFALGIVTGALGLTRENALVLAVPLLLWALTRDRSRLGLAGAFLLGLGVALAPAAARNVAVGGELVLTTSQLGPNLYIGNHEGADGTYRSLRPRRGDARYEREDAVTLAEDAAGRKLSAAEVSSFYVSRVAAYVRAHPVEWLRLLGRKALLAFHRLEVVDTEDPYATAEHSTPLSLLGTLFHFGLLAPLGVAGIVATWDERARLWPLYVTAVLYWASVVVFYVFARYRFPLVPVLVLFAAAALVRARGFWKGASARRRAVLAGAAAAVLAASHLPLLARAPMEALTHYNWAGGLLEAGRAGEAEVEYRAALALDPDYAEAHNNLGALYRDRGETARALQHLRRAVALDPSYPEARNNLGSALLDEGRASEAEAELREAIRLEPGLAEAHNNLGNALSETGRPREARAAYERAVQLDPDNARAHHNLGTLLFETRELRAAKERFETATRLDESNPRSWNNLGIVLAIEGRLGEAAACFERAIRIDPDYAEARRNLERSRRPP